LVSASSSHGHRLATIRRVHERYGVIVDTHTADGIKGGLEHRDGGVPLVCLETAQPAKFAETIREALGRHPERPAAYVDIERKPLRFDTMDADPAAIKRYIADRVAG
jgi:threonine synthase